jgi:hypothetical protein
MRTIVGTDVCRYNAEFLLPRSPSAPRSPEFPSCLLFLEGKNRHLTLVIITGHNQY